MHVVRRKDRPGWNVGRRQEVVIMHVIKSEHVGRYLELFPATAICTNADSQLSPRSAYTVIHATLSSRRLERPVLVGS